MYLFLKALALPPANLAVAILFGLLLRRRARRTGTLILVAAVAGLYLLSTPYVATRLLVAVENAVAPPNPRAEPKAIVILSAGLVYATPIGRHRTVDAMTLERLRHGARLHRATGLPVLVTGGPPRNVPTPVAVFMQQVLEEDFGVASRWVETRARNTNENALFSAAILRDEGIGGVYLVSQAWHLPRAMMAFGAAGLSATPAPSSYSRAAYLHPLTIMPNANALRTSYYALHEALGMVWYRTVLFDAR